MGDLASNSVEAGAEAYHLMETAAGLSCMHVVDEMQ